MEAGDSPKKPPEVRFLFGSLRSTRQTLERLIRRYNGALEEERDHTTFRNNVAGFNTLLSYWRAEMDEELEDRIRALEERAGIR